MLEAQAGRQREKVWQLAVYTGEQGVGHGMFTGKCSNGAFKESGGESQSTRWKTCHCVLISDHRLRPFGCGAELRTVLGVTEPCL